MKAIRVVMPSPTEAVIYLQPSWFARLFGASVLVCELIYEYPFWMSKHTRRRLSHMSHSAELEYALEFYPHEWDRGYDGPLLPEARLLEGQE